jgi:tRNA nucleotidyltransferase (CCA-adding enzyme)
MAKPGGVYPQVEPTAAALMDRRVLACPPGRRVADAAAAARRARAEVLHVGGGRAVTRSDLDRASRWGLGRLRVAEIAWPGLPTVSASAPEVRVRRLLLGGAAMILVRDGRHVVGVIDGERVDVAHPALSLAHRSERQESRWGEDGLWLCHVAGKVGEGLGAPVFATGGFVRDLLLDRPPADVDLLVEGDGVAFARRLSEEVGGSLVVHAEFGTASIEGARGAGEAFVGRVDIASARRERYELPGALPAVSAATVDEDLRRRDFSVNAMAMALSPSAFGRVLDPLGGQLDLKRRRLRPLSPLSFVEDPTRIFRAARYASRLGFRLDPRAVRALKLCLRIAGYPALSGQRLRAELELLTSEPSGWQGLELVLKWGGLTLWDHGYRSSPRSRARLRASGRLCAWARREGIALDPSEVALIALLTDQRPSVVTRSLGRLAFTGEPFVALRAAAGAHALARRLGGATVRRPSKVADLLQPCPVQVLVGAWLQGDKHTRRRVEWFLSRGRAMRPLLSGAEVVTLGVEPGPEVGRCLGALRRLRLDGALATLSQERGFVKQWLATRRVT